MEKKSDLGFIAVDWSGSIADERRSIWVAEWRQGEVVDLRDGLSREEVVNHVIDRSTNDPRLVVGFDFAFSFPSWFLRENRCLSAPEVWRLAELHGESWLNECKSPFFGKAGTKRPKDVELFRACDRRIAKEFRGQPKSIFQVCGAGTVAHGSIRGMRYLSRLAQAGFHVWPFQRTGLPLCIEVYPRACLRSKVVKSDEGQRWRYLDEHCPKLASSWLELASKSDHAFDALTTVLAMAEYGDGFFKLPSNTDRETQLEGQIWYPSWSYASL